MFFTDGPAIFLLTWALSMMFIAAQHFHLALLVTKVNYDKSVITKPTANVLQKIFVFAGGAYFFDALPKLIYVFQSSEILVPIWILAISLGWNLATSYILFTAGRELVKEI